MLTSSRSKKASPSSATGAPPTLATMRRSMTAPSHIVTSPSTPAQTTHIHTVPILPPTPKRISSTSSSSPSPVVTDPARPSRMSVTIASVNITPISGVLTPRITVKIKFRTKETHQMEVTMDPNAAVKEPVEFLLTYHGHHFDKLKVDAFEGIAGWRRKVVHRGRGRVALRDMEDWHNGSYRREVPLLDPTDGTTITGAAVLIFKFSAIVLPDEDPELLLSPNDETPEELLLDTIYSKYYDDDDEGSEEEEFQDASEVAEEILKTSKGNYLREEGPNEEDYAVRNFALPQRLETRKRFLRTGTMDSISDDMERPRKPTSDRTIKASSTSIEQPSDQSSRRSTSRSRSIRSRSTTRTAQRSITLPTPRLMSDNASRNLTEITAVTLNVLKHEFPLTSLQIIRSIQLLYRFENGLPLPRTGHIVKDVDHATRAVRFMKHALCVYGSLVLGFCNGTMNVRDNVRRLNNEKTMVEYLGLKLEDVLFWDKSKREISKAKYYVVHDRVLDAVVVCCQGTIHLTQILTDLNAEYFPVQNGAAHRGILRAAQSIIDDQLPSLLTWCRDLRVSSLICTGHSLGGGTAALLSILLHERLDDFKRVTGNPNFFIKGHCIATPAVANHALADPHFGVVDNYILENDVVPRMSFGSVTNFKEMVLEAHRLLELKVPEEEAYRLLQDKRVETLKNNRDSRGIIPGRVFHIYKTVRRIPRRHHRRLNIQTSLFEEAYRTVNLPPTEHPEIPHYVMELARPEIFAFVAPRRHIFNHHLPWAYSKGVWGVLEWLEKGEEVVKGKE